jgi:hypothetical protein
MDKPKPKSIPLTDSPRHKSVKLIPLSSNDYLDSQEYENNLENNSQSIQKLETKQTD